MVRSEGGVMNSSEWTDLHRSLGGLNTLLLSLEK